MRGEIVSLVLSWALACGAATISVDLDAPHDPGPGDPAVSDPMEDGSLEHPFDEIQEGIDAAVDGDAVLVDAGEYVIDSPITFRNKAIAVESVSGPEETKIIMAANSADPLRASVIIFESGETEESVLNEFALEGGRGTKWGDERWESGGGVLCINGSSPVLTNCIISGNGAMGMGGGVYCANGSSPVLANCIITSNYASSGGGVFCRGSSPELTSCMITKNCTLDAFGGGIDCEQNSCPVLSNCTIMGNDGYWGGGVSCRGSSPVLTDCTITGNSSGSGGGVYCGDNSSPMLINCTIIGNSASGEGQGGGITCFESSPELVNCTITGNYSYWYGGGVSCGRSSPTLTNCIVWDNADVSIWVDELSAPTVTYSCVEGEEVWEGEGNIHQDPIFVQPGHWDDSGTPDNTWDDIWIDGDYHLQPASLCIDTGTAERAPATDIEGNARPCWRGVDIGAYEYCGEEEPPFLSRFLRGDTNADAAIDIADAIFILSCLFGDGPVPSCLDAADANDDGAIDVSDAIYVLHYLFVNGPRIPRPHPGCGIDPTVDALGCLEYTPCDGR